MPVVCVSLTWRHRRERLQWATRRLLWHRNRWQHVIFSDESHLYFAEAIDAYRAFMGRFNRRVKRRNPQPESLAQLRDALLQEWNNIPQAVIRHFISSMRRKLTEVIDSRGAYTRYLIVNLQFRHLLVWLNVKPEVIILKSIFLLDVICFIMKMLYCENYIILIKNEYFIQSQTLVSFLFVASIVYIVGNKVSIDYYMLHIKTALHLMN